MQIAEGQTMVGRRIRKPGGGTMPVCSSSPRALVLPFLFTATPGAGGGCCPAAWAALDARKRAHSIALLRFDAPPTLRLAEPGSGRWRRSSVEGTSMPRRHFCPA